MMIDLLLEENNIENAIEHVLQGNIKFDIYGMSIDDLPAYWLIHKDDLISALKNGDYLPHDARLASRIFETGKERTVASFSAIDLLLHRALHQLLFPVFSPAFSEHSYAYLPNKSTADAVHEAKIYLENGSIKFEF